VNIKYNVLSHTQKWTQVALDWAGNGAVVYAKSGARSEGSARVVVTRTRNPAIAEGPRDAGVPVEIW